MTTQAPGRARVWWLAARPRTLSASLSPVLVGSAVAFSEGRARFLPALACLCAALLLQLAANFINDFADHARGADAADRHGPPRAAQQGWLSHRALRRAALFALVGAFTIGLYLVAEGGWPIAIGGAAALFCAWAYTGGPLPLGYHGLGDLLVFVFFGLFAVVGTHWVQAGVTSPAAFAAALPVGLLATILLAVNNLRDRRSDARAGKRTLAVHLGERGARRYTLALLVGCYLSLVWVHSAGVGLWAALPLLSSAPFAVKLGRSILRDQGAALNRTLAGVARLGLVFAALLALAFGMTRWPG